MLQPDAEQRFVYGATDHPMLPPGPNLFTVRDPVTLASATEKLKGSLEDVATSASLRGTKVVTPAQAQR